VRAALKQLETDYEQRGIELRQIDQGFRFQSREKYAEWIGRLSEERPVRYSRALLETLAIIAYRQPVTRGEIEDIRGVAVSTDIIKTLVGRDWVRQVGTRDVPGRPALYGTTRGFLEHFNLKGLDALPPLVELRDIDKIAAELNMSLPMDDVAQAGEGESPEMDAASSGGHASTDAVAESELSLQAGADDAGSPAAKL
jgi:segregation and condensation protein B